MSVLKPPPSRVVPPPMRITEDGPLGRRDLTHAEAREWHLHRAAEAPEGPVREWYLEQAERNRVWGAR